MYCFSTVFSFNFSATKVAAWFYIVCIYLSYFGNGRKSNCDESNECSFIASLTLIYYLVITYWTEIMLMRISASNNHILYNHFHTFELFFWFFFAVSKYISLNFNIAFMTQNVERKFNGYMWCYCTCSKYHIINIYLVFETHPKWIYKYIYQNIIYTIWIKYLLPFSCLHYICSILALWRLHIRCTEAC